MIALLTFKCFQIRHPECFLSRTLWYGYLSKKLDLIWAEYFQPSVVSIYLINIYINVEILFKTKLLIVEFKKKTGFTPKLFI